MQKTYSQEDITERFKESITLLKEQTFKKDQTKISFLELPWYLMIGKKNCGKTTLLENADLKYLFKRKTNLQDQEIKTQFFDWWVVKNAVIMDITGDFFQPKDEQWDKLLSLLSRRAYKKSIHGVMITLEIDDVINPQKEMIKTIEQQIITIQKIFGRDTPIHLILNKLDHLSGFHEFFNESSIDERWQACGIPLLNNKKIEPQINKHFSKITKRIYDQLIWRLQHETDQNKRALINDFPQQLIQLHAHLIHFTGQLGNTVQALNGIYFTAANAVPFAHNSASHAITIQSNLSPSYSSAKRAFFIHDLLINNILIQDKNGFKKKGKLSSVFKFLTFMLFLLLSMTLAGYWFYNFRQETTKINKAEKSILETRILLQTYQVDHHKISLPQILTILNQLQHSEQTLDIKSRTISLGLLNKTRPLDIKIFTAYNQILNKIFIPKISRQFERAMQDSNLSTELLYSALKSYLMFKNNIQYDPEYITLAFKKIFGTEYTTETYAALLNIFQSISDEHLDTQPMNHALVTQAQKRLNALTKEQLGYIILQNNIPNNQLLSLNLKSNEEAASVLTFINYDTDISSMYTAQAYSLVYPRMIKQAAKEAYNGNAFLGKSNTVVTKKQINQLTKKLEQQYKLNYADAWLQFINNIEMVNYTNMQQIKQALDILTGDQSPLLQLINIIQENLVSPVASLNKNLEALKTIPINNNDLKALNLYLSPLTSTQNSDQAAFQLASYRMRNHGQHDPIEKLIQSSRIYPEPIRSWMYNLAMNSWQLILYQTQNYLNQLWQTTILPQYNAQLKGRFPFDLMSNQTISLDSFKFFFSPNGLFNTFLSNYLAPFIDTSSMPWKMNNIDGTTLQLHKDTLAALQQAYSIQHLFFTDSNNLVIPFKLQPINMSDDIEKATIAIGAQHVTFQNKPPFSERKFIWPDDMNANFSKITLIDKNAEKIIFQESGPWSWLKLLHGGKFSIKESNQFAIKFTKKHQNITLALETENNQYPFDFNNLENFKIPGKF